MADLKNHNPSKYAWIIYKKNNNQFFVSRDLKSYESCYFALRRMPFVLIVMPVLILYC